MLKFYNEVDSYKRLLPCLEEKIEDLIRSENIDNIETCSGLFHDVEEKVRNTLVIGHPWFYLWDVVISFFLCLVGNGTQ